MARRNWIKIYPEGFLRRTLFDELLPIERWVWIGFLCLAGDNALDGRICVTEDMGYTDEQLAKLLDIDIDILKVSKKKMVKFKKISVDKNNVIQIISWNIYQSEYQRQKQYRQSSPESRLNYRISLQIYDSLKSNKGGRHWEDLVGYTLKDLKKHLESKFTKGMSWENQGKWHIDHIIPKSSFHFNDYRDEEFKECWALENLQPLWAAENLQKSNKDIVTQGYNAGLHIDRDKDRDRDKEEEEDKNKTIKGSIPYQEIKDSYNKYRNKMPEIKILSDNRKNTIRLRYKKYGDDLFTLFEKASKSDFLNGSNDRNWIANFDWLLKEANLVKVLEGNYDNKTSKGEDYGRPYRKG